ncbi:MAG TPA: DUF1292 domain-containing protein [Clostridiaceae bacterium]|nr:DUF1292 domain-containing protein [Clostridiaceae bacterium]
MRRNSNKSERFRKGHASESASRHRTDDQVLAILVDERNGREYYVSMIDVFTLDGTTYTVMYNYEPDDGTRADPEIVIMRSWRDDSGEQAFSSIKSKKELDRAFDFFFERYTDSIIRS